MNDYLFLYSHMETCPCNPYSPNSLDCQMLTRVDWRVEFYILLSRIHKMLYRAYIDNHKVILEKLVYHFFYLNALLFKITENWCLTKERNSKQIKENEKEIVVWIVFPLFLTAPSVWSHGKSAVCRMPKAWLGNVLLDIKIKLGCSILCCWYWSVINRSVTCDGVWVCQLWQWEVNLTATCF